MAEYRDGRFAVAAEWFEKSLAANHDTYAIYQVQVTAHGVQKTEIGDIAWTFSQPVTMYTLRAAAPARTVSH